MYHRFRGRIRGRIKTILFVIGFAIVLEVGIFGLLRGNTIFAQEIQYEEQEQGANRAATFILDTRQPEQRESEYIHIFAFGTVLLVSGSTAGILVTIRKRRKTVKNTNQRF